MRKFWAWVACIALMTATVGVVTPAVAAKGKPKIVKGEMMDRDGNNIPDAVFLWYSQKVKHSKDADGKYPFTVEGYVITNVGKTQGKLLIINLEEDIAAPSAPVVSYKQVKKGAVKAATGKKKQAKKQTFRNVAPFTPLPTNHVTVIVEGAGTVTSVPTGIACPSTSCEGDFIEGRTVVLVAFADILSGATFMGWGGDCSGTEPACQLTMDGTPKTVTATFSGVIP
ncbi:MAG: hypothetical protein GEU71_14465 [Actinobacteria bacterium]|nr:hypothetical protein [Actinomycetota bacterium]